MRWFRDKHTPDQIAAWMKGQAARGTYDGIMTPRAQVYCAACTSAHYSSGSILLLTRDEGMHSCVWWKNPDYERCLHLSLSFRDPQTGLLRSKDTPWSSTWIEAVFGHLKTLIWTEPPVYPEGKAHDVWHYRVFLRQVGRFPSSLAAKSIRKPTLRPIGSPGAICEQNSAKNSSSWKESLRRPQVKS